MGGCGAELFPRFPIPGISVFGDSFRAQDLTLGWTWQVRSIWLFGASGLAGSRKMFQSLEFVWEVCISIGKTMILAHKYIQIIPKIRTSQTVCAHDFSGVQVSSGPFMSVSAA